MDVGAILSVLLALHHKYCILPPLLFQCTTDPGTRLSRKTVVASHSALVSDNDSVAILHSKNTNVKNLDQKPNFRVCLKCFQVRRIQKLEQSVLKR